MLSIHPLTSAAPGRIAELSALLLDAVHGGASVGFLAPLSRPLADAYWEQVFASLGPGLLLWVAEVDGRIVGAVQLAPCQKANGAHRAEIQKLFVLQSHRGRGIAAALMRRVEQHAQESARTLLVLDTEAGSAAERLYRRLGWEKAGEIPDYAASPEGVLHPTALYFKRLRP